MKLTFRRSAAFLGVAVALSSVNGCGRDDASVLQPQTTIAKDIASIPAAAVRLAGRARVTPAEFHKRNPMDWVGVTHNRAVDKWRSEMRARTLAHIAPPNLCLLVSEFAANRSGFSEGASAATKAELNLDVRRRLSGGVCKPAPKKTSPVSEVLFHRSAAFSDDTLTARGAVLVADVTAAIGVATDATDLATLLASIQDSAATLSQPEIDFIDGASSVGLSSWEYWNANLDDAVDEVDSAYIWAMDDCSSQNRIWDYTTMTCGGYAETNGASVRRAPRSITMSFVTLSSRRKTCMSDLRAHFGRNTATADVGGFVGGAVAGWMLGPAVLATAGAGAVGGSVGAEVIMFGEYISCRWFS